MKITIEQEGKEPEVLECDTVLITAIIKNALGEHDTKCGVRGKAEDGTVLELYAIARNRILDLYNIDDEKVEENFDKDFRDFRKKKKEDEQKRKALQN